MPAYSVSLRMRHTLTTAAVFVADIAAEVAHFCARPTRPEGHLPGPHVAFFDVCVCVKQSKARERERERTHVVWPGPQQFVSMFPGATTPAEH